MNKYGYFAAVVLILAGALFLRLYRLDRESVFFDESVAVGMDASTSLTPYFDGVLKADPTMSPLYFSCLWGWCRAWGYSDNAYRSLSLLFGLLSIAAAMFAARDFFGSRKESLLAGLLLAISTINVAFCREIRMYSLYLLLSAVSIWGVTRMLKNMRHGTWMSAAANMLLLWTHLMSPTLFIVEGLALLFFPGKKATRLLPWVFPQLLNLLLWYWTWGRHVSFGAIDAASGNKHLVAWSLATFKMVFASQVIETRLIAPLLTPLDALGIFVLGLALILCAAVRLAKTYKTSRKVDHALLFLLGLACVPIAGAAVNAFVYPVWVPRYTIYTQYALIFCMIAGAGLFGGGEGAVLNGRLRRVRLVILGCVVLLFGANWLVEPPPMNPDWKSALKCIDDDRPISVFPGNHVPCVKRLHPSNQVRPFYAPDPAAISEPSWIVVFRFLGVHRPRPVPSLPPGAELVHTVAREGFYSIHVWKTSGAPSGAAPAQASVNPETQPAGPPNVVWVLLDACRSDHLSCYGYDRATSPVIDELAKSGVLFENNYAQGLWTKLSVPAFMTGKFFPVSCLDFGGGENVPRVVPPDEKLLPEILRENGYDTVCVSAHPYISPRSRLYQAFQNSTLVPSPDKYPSPSLAQMLPAVEAALNRRALPAAPIFLYVHAMDTHFPHRGGSEWAAAGYESPNIKDGTPVSKTGCRFSPEDQACLRGLHDSSIQQADQAIGKLKTLLAQRGLDKNTLFVISSDHGDLLGEDGTTWGHETIADPVLRTPLILSGPGLPAGRHVAGLTRCVDILPTLLDLTGAKSGATMQGVSLMPVIRGEKAETGEPVFSRAGVYETGGVFMLIDREHRYEHDVKEDTDRFVPANASAGHESATLSEAAAGPYRAVMDNRVLPLWNAYTALPCLYRHFDFSKHFDPAWATPAEAVASVAGQAPGADDTTDNRWTFAGGTLWAANWAEQPPPLTLTLDLEPGRYQVSVWLNGTRELLGHAGSSVQVEVMGAPPVEAAWTESQRTAFPVYSCEVAEVDLPDGHCRITLRPGKQEYWSAVAGIGLIRSGGKTVQGGGASGAEYREQLRTLGYVN